jgi:Cu-Zn family superoxide dismutase
MNRKMTRDLIGVGLTIALVAGAGCATSAQSSKKSSGKEPEAVAVIASKSDSHLTGKATFHAEGGKVTLKVEIAGAEPGTHAVHLHEKGDCSAADGSSAGGHWNPTSENHGKWAAAPFHHGDIGNVEVGADGKGTLTLTTDLWTIGGAPETDVVGKAVIVHAKADDFTTQPTGNAGGRVGCGVVEMAKK